MCDMSRSAELMNTLRAMAEEQVDAFRAAVNGGVPLRLGGGVLGGILDAHCGLAPDLFDELVQHHAMLPWDKDGLRKIAVQHRANLRTLRRIAEMGPDRLFELYKQKRCPSGPGEEGHPPHPPHGLEVGSVIIVALGAVLGLLGLWVGLRLISMRVRFIEAASLWLHLVGLCCLALIPLMIGLLFSFADQRDDNDFKFALCGSISIVTVWLVLGTWWVCRAYPAATTLRAAAATVCGGATTLGVLAVMIYIDLLTRH